MRLTTSSNATVGGSGATDVATAGATVGTGSSSSGGGASTAGSGADPVALAGGTATTVAGGIVLSRIANITAIPATTRAAATRKPRMLEPVC
jgi:hypothetical protein